MNEPPGHFCYILTYFCEIVLIECLDFWFILYIQKLHGTVDPGKLYIKSFTNLGNDSWLI